MLDVAPQLDKAAGADLDAGSMTQGMESGGAGVGHAIGGRVQRKASDAAAAGFAGGGQEIPYRAEMEKSFGQDFSGVRAHTDGAAQNASKELGANAYAVGNNVAFGLSTPDKSLVAHELTHVLQQSNGGAGAGPQAKGAGDIGGIDKSGEHEAEAVEGAVKSGKPALSALQGGKASGGGPALKAGKGIARSEHGAPFTFGMSFSPEAMEKTYEYNLWNSKFEVPIPAVPGLNFKIAPSVKVVGGGGVNWHHKALEAKLGVLGNVQMGFSYGHSELAEVYGVMEAKAEVASTTRSSAAVASTRKRATPKAATRRPVTRRPSKRRRVTRPRRRASRPRAGSSTARLRCRRTSASASRWPAAGSTGASISASARSAS